MLVLLWQFIDVDNTSYIKKLWMFCCFLRSCFCSIIKWWSCCFSKNMIIYKCSKSKTKNLSNYSWDPSTERNGSRKLIYRHHDILIFECKRLWDFAFDDPSRTLALDKWLHNFFSLLSSNIFQTFSKLNFCFFFQFPKFRLFFWFQRR